MSKKPIKTAVPITGLFSVVTREINLNLSLKFNLVSLLVGFVSFNKNAAHNVPIKEIPARQRRTVPVGLSSLNEPPTNGPITKPKAKAEPKMPNFLALFCGVAVSATMACATDTLPPVKPSNILAANRMA